MDTFQLKQELIQQISRIEDIDFLNAIKNIMDYEKREAFIELTDQQGTELLYASKEGRSGNFILQSKMDQKVENWLK